MPKRTRPATVIEIKYAPPPKIGSDEELVVYAADPTTWRQRERLAAAAFACNRYVRRFRTTEDWQHQMYEMHDAQGQPYLIVPVDGRVPLLSAVDVDRAFHRNPQVVTDGSNSWLFWNHIWHKQAGTAWW